LTSAERLPPVIFADDVACSLPVVGDFFGEAPLLRLALTVRVASA